jgi:hypothetical protein
MNGLNIIGVFMRDPKTVSPAAQLMEKRQLLVDLAQMEF